MTISFPVSRMASYDEKQEAWIWEKGSYIIRVGEHSRATKVTGVIHLEKNVSIRNWKNYCRWIVKWNASMGIKRCLFISGRRKRNQECSRFVCRKFSDKKEK